jgi:hypothetical protein
MRPALPVRRNGNRNDIDAFVPQGFHFARRCRPSDMALRRLVIMYPASFFGESGSNIFRVFDNGIDQLRERFRIHVCVVRARPAIGPRRRFLDCPTVDVRSMRNTLDRAVTAHRTHEQLLFPLSFELRAGSKPALESMATCAAQLIYDHCVSLFFDQIALKARASSALSGKLDDATKPDTALNTPHRRRKRQYLSIRYPPSMPPRCAKCATPACVPVTPRNSSTTP